MKIFNQMKQSYIYQGGKFMLYRTIQKSGMELSILGMGCMRLPVTDKDDPKTIDEPKATEMVRYAIDHGVNYIDTAYPYHGGASEPFVGRVLKDGYREKVYLATKLPTWAIHTREDMDRYLNEQLERLATETIDFYLLHGLKRERWENMQNMGFVEFLERAIRDGRIRYAGFSFHGDRKNFKEIVDGYDWTFCQIQYNFLDENFQAGREGLEYAAQRGLGVVIMEPLRGGKITDELPDAIMKIWNDAETRRSPAEWGLRWVWNHPQVSVVLSGMSTLEQVQENLQTAEQGQAHSLTTHELNVIDRVKTEYKSQIKVDCTNCGYCLPCPSDVNIPDCFSKYNTAFMFENFEEMKKNYNMFIKEPNRASQCVSCGECEEKCPQQIPIQEKLQDVVRLFEQ
jgi:predicted aldo/keto reductase-like oxidoreductase